MYNARCYVFLFDFYIVLDYTHYSYDIDRSHVSARPCTNSPVRYPCVRRASSHPEQGRHAMDRRVVELLYRVDTESTPAPAMENDRKPARRDRIIRETGRARKLGDVWSVLVSPA